MRLARASADVAMVVALSLYRGFASGRFPHQKRCEILTRFSANRRKSRAKEDPLDHGASPKQGAREIGPGERLGRCSKSHYRVNP